MVTLSVKKDTICNGLNINVKLTTPNTPTREARFRYVSIVPAGVIVAPVSGSDITPNTVLTNTLVNSNNSPQLVRFVVTPYTRQASGNLEKCTGINDTIYIWLEPSVKLAAFISDTVYCNNSSISISLSTPTSATGGVVYDLTSTPSASAVSGYSPTLQGKQ
ncbi:MAG: hypothetical protein HC905_11995 [Bacteroidales bacterium]|nr:hypothetical protein [Bacteroidales bacterium]